jgi:transcriptional regulator with XRE-family HTH domain
MTPYLLIKEIRNKNKLTQYQLARKANISQSYLSELENNKKSPTLRQLCRIAEALNVKPGDLVYYL